MKGGPFALAAAIIASYSVARLSNAADILARTIWGEARMDENKNGRPDEMEAVAMVIMNRARKLKSLNLNAAVVATCLAEKQFSAWNERDPNRIKLLTVTASDPQFKLARQIADRAMAGQLPDTTGGATHYHTSAVVPTWADPAKITKVIGSHIFYTGIA